MSAGLATRHAPKAGQVFFGFCILATAITTINMRSSLAEIEDARSRWNAQKAKNDALITAYGAQHMGSASAPLAHGQEK
ncbi:hypothetical protein K490DRAFT_65345 [Saccharata proteae CBS 121410]|uniref:Uncharacterized protein n=1 Tax=Saccharata proteae CBS 121410 TaxID=1314787 RepID=A0A9P4HYF3_9PEZI|nr:hypothetical protein K490DRAFT_65345 [Saccharata proteae CBS 121410]